MHFIALHASVYHLWGGGQGGRSLPPPAPLPPPSRPLASLLPSGAARAKFSSSSLPPFLPPLSLLPPPLLPPPSPSSPSSRPLFSLLPPPLLPLPPPHLPPPSYPVRPLISGRTASYFTNILRKFEESLCLVKSYIFFFLNMRHSGIETVQSLVKACHLIFWGGGGGAMAFCYLCVIIRPSAFVSVSSTGIAACIFQMPSLQNLQGIC